MTMQFKCNCCGQVAAIPQLGPGGSASDLEPNAPPKGWRVIYTRIEEHDGDGRYRTNVSEVLHSCADCNTHMSLDEHLEAEYEARKKDMRPAKSRQADSG